MSNRYKVTYLSKTGASHYTVVIAKDSDRAREEFLQYYSSPGDEITNIALETEEAG